MAATQITKPLVFQNGYCTSIDSNVGWNQQPSRLTLNIVDIPDQDFTNNTATQDLLNPPTNGYIAPEVGSFQTFNLSGIMSYQGSSGISSPFKFQGIVVSNNIPKRTDGDRKSVV